LLATRIFELALHIEPDFASGPADYLKVGASGLLPFVVYSIAAAAVLGLVSGIGSLSRARTASLRARWTALTASLDPTAVAASIFLLGAAGAIAITYAYYDIFSALDVMRANAFVATPDLGILSPAAHDMHRAHGGYSAFLSFVLGFAAWRWFPRLERRGADAPTIRLLKWATVAVIFLMVGLAIAPRRIIWERFDVVAFENRPALVIGANEDELLLYSPDPPQAGRWRVLRDSPALRRTGFTRKLFEPSPGEL
jgi:hypothetical protein